MAGSNFGTILRLSTFGESHGKAMGGVIDGLPANMSIDLDAVQDELNRRRPGQSSIVTPRDEQDKIEVLSGIFGGKTTGTPLGFIIRNKDQQSKDYRHIKDNYRPSHADYTYDKKYGIRDYRGGGRSSARETVCRVVAGAIARQILATKGISIQGCVDQVGSYVMQGVMVPEEVEQNIVRSGNLQDAEAMQKIIEEARDKGDTVGGSVYCEIKGLPAGLGEPIFDKFHAVLGQAVLSINAVKGIEFGSGFAGIEMNGSQHNDRFNTDGRTQTNNSGGVQGGITNGMPVYFRTAFKPVSTIMQEQKSINKDGEEVILDGKGRHDPCVVPRAVPIVEAMAAFVTLDFILRQQTTQLT